jgi:valyl-tRNA synthetase
VEELAKQYDHLAAQERWYPVWEKRGYFASDPDPDRRRFPKGRYTIVIPPPNVTGALHLGHALNNTLQDILIRSRRMQGYNTLWMPGTDHAGIATQAVVERRLLQEEKKTRHDLGRESLVARIWAWKDEYEARILDQLKQMGCSCDWRRTRFTLDEQCARAVRHTFFRMFKAGLIYRGKRLVNWDTFLQTAVSDDEVFHETVKGHFWHFRYPVIDPQPGEPTHVTIATTRPETMLGDTAVAVHPDPAPALAKAERELRDKLAAAPAKERAEIERQIEDMAERRQTLLPQLEKLRDMARELRKLRLPLLNREIPLITDEWAKPELGTGCVKITPAHDPNDYDVWQRRKEIGAVSILNPDGTLNENAGPYRGLKIMKAREQIVADLDSQGLLEKVEDREIDLAHSDRSKTPIEPYLADQWFVRMGQVAASLRDATRARVPPESRRDSATCSPGLAQMAMDAVTGGRVKIHPERYAKTYLDWLGEKRDWCIGRQLWWGHRVPIWYAPTASEADLKNAFAGHTDIVWQRDERNARWLICAEEIDLPVDAIPGHSIKQDPDVLDTWFSSALWPHSTLGWPEQTPELAYYYPTSALLTSRGIITLWVARMVLAGLFNLGEVPFYDVNIHPTILDGYGETMSKSKGNGVDPLDVINKFGADALRFGLAELATETQDVRLPVEFECPHCKEVIEQTQKNRVQPRVKCPHCANDFSTQWASKPEDAALPRAPVISDRFEKARNFCNKLWNAARFTLLNLEGYAAAGSVDLAALTTEDRWLLSRLTTVNSQVTDALDQFHFADAARQLYDFAWDEFCSFYLEMVKTRLAEPSSQATAQRILAHVLDTIVRLLHPMIPFITEEIWQRLGEAAPERGLEEPTRAAESVMIAPWPEADRRLHDAEIESQFAKFQAVLSGLREARSRQNIPPKTPIKFAVKTDPATQVLLEPMSPYFASMAGATATAWGPGVQAPRRSANFAAAGCEVYVDLAGHIDLDAERARSEKELENLRKQIDAKEKKLANENFVSRAPAEVVQKERESLTALRDRLQSTTAALEELKRA